MKLFIILATVLVAANATGKCFTEVNKACSEEEERGNLGNCNATYGDIEDVLQDLQDYTVDHIRSSFDLLLLSTHFANYEKNRPGFEKLYRKLSDSAWEDAICLIKHITKRGGVMNFDKTLPAPARTIDVSELESMAYALDIEKALAERAIHIHGEITRRREMYHDAEIGHYLEEEFIEKHTDTIRQLAGHTNDLKLFAGEGQGDMPLSLFMFDEYLQKA